MIISGLQKMTLLDFPHHVACSVFLKGCNFRCPFCYNSSLIDVNEESTFIKEEDFFTFLNSRKNKLDGVAITGGEPLLQKDIVNFIKKIKDLGFLVKLDTNGTSPDILQSLIEEKLVDYVAMDIKNCLSKYPMTTNCNCDVTKIEQSINILLNSNIDYEFRTTVVKEFHKIDDFEKIGKMIKGAKNYFIQSYQHKDSVIDQGLSAHSKEMLTCFLGVVKKYVNNASIRGID